MSIHEQYVSSTAETEAEVREQLHEQGYANIAIGVGNDSTKELFDTFKDFVALTEEQGGDKLKELVKYTARSKSEILGNEAYFTDLRIPGKHNQNESSSRAPGDDHKYIFHFGPQTFARALDKRRRNGLPEELNTLLAQCSEFYYEGRKTAQLGAAALGIEKVLFGHDPTREVHHLRLIDYVASESKEHAKGHFDRGVVTLAINESHSGLRGIGADNGSLAPLTSEQYKLLEDALLPVSHEEYVGKFFASAGLRRLPEVLRAAHHLDEIPLFAHDVVNEKPGINRQAAVMFFNPTIDFPKYTVPLPSETDLRYLPRF